MIPVGSGTKVYLAIGATDLRKAIRTLSALVAGKYALDPFSGHLFAFCNRDCNLIKMLLWDRNGFWLLQKRLEKQRFKWPSSADAVAELSQRELRWLLDGLDLAEVQGHRQLEYNTVY